MTMPQSDQATTGRRSEVLRFLRDIERPVSIAEIATSLDLHANTVRFHLETLASNDQVERTTADHGRPGRPPQLFTAVRGMDPMGPRHYRMLAEVLTASLAAESDPGQRATEAGRLWGHRQASAATAGEAAGASGTGKVIEHLVSMLDDLDFAPELVELRDGGDLPAIGLRHCPFLELASIRSDVVCAIHLGLMRGALESWYSPVTVDRLDAFDQPDLCMAYLALAGAS